MARSGLSIRQRRVAAKLREWRKRQETTQEQLAARLRWSNAKVSRLENPKGREALAGPAEVIAIATVLGIPDAERDQIAALAMEGPGWWTEFGRDAVPDFVADYFEIEAEATVVRNVETILVPGLLQTAAYIDALMQADSAVNPIEDHVADERRRLRQQRQSRLDQPSPLALHVIMNQAALETHVGGPGVMVEQLDHILTRADQNHITVQVLPSSIGAYPGMGGSYHLLTFDDSSVSVVYIETVGYSSYIEDAVDVASFTMNFEQLARTALDPQASAQLIREAREGWT